MLCCVSVNADRCVIYTLKIIFTPPKHHPKGHYHAEQKYLLIQCFE